MVLETQLYDVLGIALDASDAQIKKAYRINALKYHPDKNKDPEAPEVFKGLAHAYEVLSDPEQRQLYDEYGARGLDGDSGGSHAPPDLSFNAAQNIFSHFFGNSVQTAMNQSFEAMFGDTPAPLRRGKDIRHPLKCTLEDLYRGRTAKLALMKTVLCGGCQGLGVLDASNILLCFGCHGHGKVVVQRPCGAFVETHESTCHKCHGTGNYVRPQDQCLVCRGQMVVQERAILTVHVPPGSRHGDCLVLEGEGDQFPNMIPGNVVVLVDEQAHPVFKRKGYDLIHAVQVDLKTALCGGVVDIPSLEGLRTLRVTLQQGEIITPGKLKMLTGYGMPIPDLSHQGHQASGAPTVMVNTPHYPRPLGHGSIYVKFTVRFPRAQDLTPEAYAQLEAVLPTTPCFKRCASETAAGSEDEPDVEECVLSDITQYAPPATPGTPRRAKRAKRDTDDDLYVEIDGDDDQAVQCATQ